MTISEIDETTRHTIEQCMSEVNSFISTIFSTVLLPLRSTDNYLKVESIEKVLSAQQCVFILTIRQDDVSTNVQGGTQFSSHPIHNKEESNSNQNDDGYKMIQTFQRAIEEGNGRIILRIWKGGARWWNFNSNHEGSYLELSRAEVTAYRIAKASFFQYNQICTQTRLEHHQHVSQDLDWKPTRIITPEVLYYSHDQRHASEITTNAKSQPPWAIFSYVGKDSAYFTSNLSIRQQDNNFIREMVKVRHEYGFDEPHPRHGRVNTEQALDYAMEVLNSVILPLHSAFFLLHFSPRYIQVGKESEEENHFDNDYIVANSFDVKDLIPFRPLVHAQIKTPGYGEYIGYNDMVQQCKHIIIQMMEQNKKTRQEHRDTETDNKTEVLLQLLEKCITTLSNESITKDNTLPPVLVHMDLQPQNMILQRSLVEKSFHSVPDIISVLDWEEACYADPRFELVLLCRKVVANRSQANKLWEYYSRTMQQRFDIRQDNIGALDTWLKLEGVLSATTLTMQAMNLQGGGRNPWETKPDLWEKISRELQRLSHLGWQFCQQEIE